MSFSRWLRRRNAPPLRWITLRRIGNACELVAPAQAGAQVSLVRPGVKGKSATVDAVHWSPKDPSAGGGDCDNMTIRTLVLQRLQFGLEPLAFRRGATRVLARVAGRPREEAPVTAEDLRQDFRLDAASAEALLRALVANRLLERANTTSDYRLTERFR